MHVMGLGCTLGSVVKCSCRWCEIDYTIISDKISAILISAWAEIGSFRIIFVTGIQQHLHCISTVKISKRPPSSHVSMFNNS